jgi:clan AA aspartic protease (TIGR02281 family)
MNKWIVLLVILLAASLSGNLILWREQQLIETNTEQPVLTDVQQNSPGFSWNTKSEVEIVQSQETPRYSNQENLDSDLSAPDINQLNREEILNQAHFLFAEKNINDLSALLISYLKQHPQDMDFLLIEAKLKVETGLLSDAIVNYYSLLRQPMTLLQQTNIEEQISKLSSTSINQLKSTYSWNVLAEFVEPLLQIDPDNRLYILSLARAYAELFQDILMENILAALPFDDPAANAIRRIVALQQARLEQQTSDEGSTQSSLAELGRSVELQQFGDQYVVKAKLSDNEIELLIDTGASITTVSQQFYKNLSNRYKNNFLGRFSVSTANGTVRAPMYQFRDLVINHAKVEKISIVVLPMRGLKNANGLLGMNFLREFDFKIDQRQSLMFIE